jgi:iron complex outermembrane receptor protein
LPAAARAAFETALDEVVVTARKRAENAQDTPIAVSVFTAADLRDRTAANLPDIAVHSPNLRSSVGPQGGSSGHYFIRGVGQLDFIASTDPGVGTYLDGVYLGRTTGAAFDLLEVERVEVLRGPQGTLFGRNTIGGAIQVVSAPPPEEPRRRIALGAGSRDRFEGRLSVGGPILRDRLRVDVAALARVQQGWQRRLVAETPTVDEHIHAARLTLDWRASPRVSVQASFDGTRSRGSADPHYLAAADESHGGRPEFVVTDPRVTWSGQSGRDDLDVRGAALTVAGAFGGFTVKSISAWRDLDSRTGIDFDGSPAADLDQLVFTKQRQFSQELQFSGSSWAERLDWLVGLYTFGERVEQNIPLVFYGTAISQNNEFHGDSSAAFAHLGYALTPRLAVSGGARLSHESKRHAFDHYIDRGAVREPLFPPTTLRDRWNAFTPKLGLEFRATPELLLYASAAQGFRSGGFNGRPLGTAEFLSYRPETLTTFEAGFKSEWLDRRLRVNVAAFHSRYEDIQLTLTTVSPEGIPIVVVGNAGEAKLHGLELGVAASIATGLQLTADLGHLRNRYTKLEPGAAVSPAARLPVSPRWTLNAGLSWVRPAPRRGRLRGRIDYAYTSRYNYLFDNPPLSWQPGYGLWNARVGYEPDDGSWSVAAWLRNATNRRYALFREDIRSGAGVAIDWPARPREWGVELEFRF